MPLSDYSKRLLALAETIYQWLAVLSGLHGAERERIALFAEEIAATLSRAAKALSALDATPADKINAFAAVRELGRITGYIETIAGALQHHLDGRKLAGVKRRLEALEPFDIEAVLSARDHFAHASRLVSAEGFFRALADAMRT